MPKVWPTSEIELKVMNIVKRHLQSEFEKYPGVLDGGIHFKYKPSKIRLKVIELGSSDYHKVKTLSDVKDFTLNINYQDENRELVEQVTERISVLLDSSVVRNLFFEFVSKEVFKISPYLWLGNNRFILINNSLYKKKNIMTEQKIEKDPNSLEVQVGKRFKEFRLTYNIKQTDIEIMQKQNVSRIENGNRLPSHELMIYMLTKYNMDLNWLLTGEKLSTRKIADPKKITSERVTK